MSKNLRRKPAHRSVRFQKFRRKFAQRARRAPPPRRNRPATAARSTPFAAPASRSAPAPAASAIAARACASRRFSPAVISICTPASSSAKRVPPQTRPPRDTAASSPPRFLRATPPRERAMFRAMRTAGSSPSIAKTLPSSGGTLTPLNDLQRVHGAHGRAAIANRRQARKRPSAPLVCSTTLPRKSSPRNIAQAHSRRAQSRRRERSTESWTRRKASTGTPAAGRPAPINRAAFLALASVRAATTVILQPVSRRRRPSARPTRPAPTMARLFGIRC